MGRKQDWADVIKTQSNLAARVPWDFRENKLTRGVGAEMTSNRLLQTWAFGGSWHVLREDDFLKTPEELSAGGESFSIHLRLLAVCRG